MTDFVVPMADPDCDGIVDHDCNPVAFHGSSAQAGAPSCLVHPTTPTDPCVLGAKGCSDDAPGQYVCVPPQNEICVPQAACASQCTTFDDGCLGKLDSTVVTHIECLVPADSEPGSCGAASTPDLSGRPSSGCGSSPMIAALDTSPMFASEHTFNGVTLAVGSADGGCGVRFTWKGGAHSTPPTAAHGVLRLAAKDGRAAYLPVIVNFTTMPCTLAAFACVLKDSSSETLWSCAQ